MDTFATIFQYVFWGGAVAFAAGIVAKMITELFKKD